MAQDRFWSVLRNRKSSVFKLELSWLKVFISRIAICSQIIAWIKRKKIGKQFNIENELIIKFEDMTTQI